jgi:hypothetical protein
MSNEIKIPGHVLRDAADQFLDGMNANDLANIKYAQVIARWMREECAKVAMKMCEMGCASDEFDHGSIERKGCAIAYEIRKVGT